jgi:hypothetical protein
LRRDLGDFQTPPELVAAVLAALGSSGWRWPRVLEPTCGRGHFIGGLLAQSVPPREIQAMEIQRSHYQAARALVRETGTRGVDVRITHGDFFGVDLDSDFTWHERGPLLVVGNPPWVTNSELGSLASAHRPPRRNIKGLRGLEARTGAANFDVAEAIWLKLVRELADQEPTIALLCKTSVARNVLQFTYCVGLPIAAASIYRIDAARWFGAAVEACLFCVTLAARQFGAPPSRLAPPSQGGARGGEGSNRSDQEHSATHNAYSPTEPISSIAIPVYPNLARRDPETVMGFARGWLVADRVAHARWSFADGVCPLTWRQGVKHDAAAVMELVRDSTSGAWRNGIGEIVDVEPESVYPFVKGGDLRQRTSDRATRALLVTQRRLGDDTARLAGQAPRLWSYLQSHAGAFAKRKSSIYSGRPSFSLFGIGPYSFAPFKVAISGLHKDPAFRALAPVADRPVMLDDTCYFLPCATAEEAAIWTALCNDRITLGLIGCMSFRDAKRPITKKLLDRLDLIAILERANEKSLIARAIHVFDADLGVQPAEPLLQVIARFKTRSWQSLGEWSAGC